MEAPEVGSEMELQKHDIWVAWRAVDGIWAPWAVTESPDEADDWANKDMGYVRHYQVLGPKNRGK